MQQITDKALKQIRENKVLFAAICEYRGCGAAHLTRTTYDKRKPEWLTLYGIVRLIMKHTGMGEKEILEKPKS